MKNVTKQRKQRKPSLPIESIPDEKLRDVIGGQTIPIIPASPW